MKGSGAFISDFIVFSVLQVLSLQVGDQAHQAMEVGRKLIIMDNDIFTQETEPKKFNLLTNREETLTAIEDIEGSRKTEYYTDESGNDQVRFVWKPAKGWLNGERRDTRPVTERTTSVLYALHWLDHIVPTGVNPESYIQVYGIGGWNRYFVYPDGTIKISRGHDVSGDSTKRAKEIGFDVFDS